MKQQAGLTLLEVLIALSIFSLIGIASYQVLNTTISSQQHGDHYSRQLSLQQKAMMIIDRDLQQIVNRDIRISFKDSGDYLQVNNDEYPLAFTRGGRRNPLLLPRSTLQRIAYDVGLHPQVAVPDSLHYKDEQYYLRRHIWSALDRTEQAVPLVQALLPGVVELEVLVITDKGRKQQWPITVATQSAKNTKPPKLLAVELTFSNSDGEQLTRLYPVL